jgi:hypothetical protein
VGEHVPAIPELEWYSGVSRERGVAVRCPFATVEACPRYFQSLSLLGEAGSTKIPKDEDERLLAKWKASDLWPRTEESTTSILKRESDPRMFSNFCPEVTFDRFGYFATHLARYADEIDLELAHQQLGKERVPGNDPRWAWSSTKPQHYTECPLYSVLAHRATAAPQAPAPIEPPWWRRYLAEIIVGVVIAVLSAILVKLFA